MSEPVTGAFGAGFDAGFDADPFDPSTATREEWQDQALCAQTDPEAFFPEKGGSTREAKKICQRCPVRGECLEYALAHDERFGIWGGLSERERRRLKRGIV
nr:WhiB family transcriptional regulator [Mycolicibacillus trivialis]